MSNECQLNEAPFYQCCCKCVNHLELYDRDTHTQKGWACVPYEHTVYAPWEEHSCGCEIYTTKEQYQEWNKPYKRLDLIRDVLLYVGCFFRHLRNLDRKNVVWSVKRVKQYAKRLLAEW